MGLTRLAFRPYYAAPLIEKPVITKYKKLFRSSPEMGILALYGLLHLTLLLAAATVEQIKLLLHILGAK